MKTFSTLKSKISIIFLMFIVFTLTITSCREEHKPNKPEQAYEEPSEELLKHIIPLEKATETYKLYGKQRVALLEDTLKQLYRDSTFKDTRMVWFDIDVMEEYIKYVREESKKAKITPDGLQFYFSVNSDKKEGDEKNHQTFFIAPTKANGKIQSGYTLDKEGKPILLKDKLNDSYKNSPNQKMQQASFFSFIQEDKGLLLNGGNDSPPNGNN